VAAEPLHEANLDRATQLLNKTNQMNLSTRRLTKEELWSWSRENGNSMLVFRVSDKFGDYGLVGIASFRLEAGSQTDARIVDFILSCRVMGRKVEETMLHVLAVSAKAVRAQFLYAEYLPTPRNQPCLAFLLRSELTNRDGAAAFAWNLRQDYVKPSAVTLVFAASDGSVDRYAVQEASLLSHG